MGQMCYEFPSDHPIREQQTVPVETMKNQHVYVYNTIFGVNGCVRWLAFCYSPHSGTKLMAIEIRNSGNGDNTMLYNVTVEADNDFRSCKYPLGNVHCCVNKTLTFMVKKNMQYALRMPHTDNLLLRHQNDTVPGYRTDLNGENHQEPLYKPLFYFNIDTSSGRL